MNKAQLIAKLYKREKPTIVVADPTPVVIEKPNVIRNMKVIEEEVKAKPKRKKKVTI